jgi:hypothetical protein
MIALMTNSGNGGRMMRIDLMRSVAKAVMLCAIVAPLAIGQTVAQWRLVEVWRKGGSTDGPFAFENVRDIKALPGGFAVLNGRSMTLTVYDSNGAVVKSSGRSGRGQGEFVSPRGMAVAPNGSIVVNDPGAGRLTTFSPGGVYVRQIPFNRPTPVGFVMPWDGTFDQSGRLVASVGHKPRKADPTLPRGADSSLMTERWATNYARSDSAELCGAGLSVYYSPSNYRVVAPNGITFPQLPFTAPGPTYARDLDGFEWGPVQQGSGELVRRASGWCNQRFTRIVLRGQRVPVPAALRQAALRDVPAAKHAAVPTTYPWFRSLRIDDEDYLWVERDGASGRRFDVYSPAGRLAAEVTAPTGLMLDDTPTHVVIGHRRLYGFVKDAKNVRYLVSWRIVR